MTLSEINDNSCWMHAALVDKTSSCSSIFIILRKVLSVNGCHSCMQIREFFTMAAGPTGKSSVGSRLCEVSTQDFPSWTWTWTWRGSSDKMTGMDPSTLKFCERRGGFYNSKHMHYSLQWLKTSPNENKWWPLMGGCGMLSIHCSSAPAPSGVSARPEHLLGLLTVSQNFRKNDYEK